MAWTNDQMKAITLDGRNILTSAGAGSGKTAVLTQRVIEKVKAGISVDKLLILTFTNLAALEMKDRIRKALKKYPEYKDEVDKLDSAYISTFDSFSLALVKKYHYILNIDKDISITPEAVLSTYSIKAIDEIFDFLYNENNDDFLQLIEDFCMKNDDDIKKSILRINNTLDSIVNKEKYLQDYFYNVTNFSLELFNDKLKKYIEEYQGIVTSKMQNLLPFIDNLLEEADPDFSQINDFKNLVIYEKDYYKICQFMEESDSYFPRKNKNCSDGYSEAKSVLKKEIDKIKEFLKLKSYGDFENQIIKTKSNEKVIVEILIKLNDKINEYKKQNKLYTFYDIAKLAIKLVQDNENIREELKNDFYEIMVDEYQDTSDIQETLIDLISNNNVYRVGDVKQSIYRFRNANPNLFMDKYNSYKDSDEDYSETDSVKIDLKVNFRSRENVISGINDIFSLIMTEEFGGANYSSSHKMDYGNKSYDEVSGSLYDTEVINYHPLMEQDDKVHGYRNSEIEAFIIASDIKKRIEEGFLIFDKEEKVFRKITYSDFAILVDKSNDFETFKKIFEFEKIPLSIYKSESLLSGNNLTIINNILEFIVKVKNKEYDERFKHLFVSLARSFLFEMNDEDIFDIIKDNLIFQTSIYQKAYNIANELSTSSNIDILNAVCNEFAIVSLAPKIAGIDKLLADIDSIQILADSLNKANMYIEDLVNLINEIKENGIKLEYDTFIDTSSAVKMMTIHKSKGLEFPICYFPGLSSAFNELENKARFVFDREIGVICPYFENGIKETFLKDIFKEKNKLQERSEKVRLFYVALTRAREKIIFVDDINDEKKTKLSFKDARSYKEYLQILYGKVPFVYNNIDDVNLNKEYKYPKENELIASNDDMIIETKNLHLSNKVLEKTKIGFSKHLEEDVKEEIIKKGTEVHNLLEIIDFKNINLDTLDINENERFIITKLLLSNLFKKLIFENKKVKIYKEYEFIDGDRDGVIDLLLENDDEFIIIDYKLSNIDDNNYDIQVRGYMDYISKMTDKTVKGYLYSLLKGTYREIKFL